MRRKVIKQGNGTLTITLPKGWTEKVGLKGGDEIDVDEKDYVLFVAKETASKEKEINLNFAEESKRYIRSHIGRLYRMGYSRMNINIDNPNLVKNIKKATDDLIGADVVEFTKTKCHVRVFNDEDSVDTDKNLSKIINTIKYMLKILQEDIKNKNFEREDVLNELRNNNWKTKDYLIRNAYLKNMPYERFNVINTMLFAYEKIGTNILGFYRLYLEGKKKNIDSKKLNGIFATIDEFLEWFLKQISRKNKIPHTEENKFRKNIRDYHSYLLNDLQKDKKMDSSLLTIFYFVVELLDSTVSYLSLYKTNYGEAYSSAEIIS